MRLTTNQLTGVFLGISAMTAITITIPALANSIPQGIAEEIRESVVQINSKGNGSPGGSGVIIDEQDNIYTVLTANHVVCSSIKRPGKISCAKDISYSVRTYTGKEYVVKDRQVLQTDQNGVDLAIITFEAKDSDYYRPVAIQDKSLETGTDIFVGGFPAAFGKKGTDREFAFTGGRVIFSQNLQNGYSLVYDANTLTGNSGGGVFDINGNLVGIHGLADASKSGFNAGIPIKTYLELTKGKLDSISTETMSPTEALKISSSDGNLQIIKSLGFITTPCASGRQIVSIMFGNNEYCVEPQPPLNALKYRYNRATKQVELFDSPKSNSTNNPKSQDIGL
ncbi:serine protease [Dolichospermum sp. ST_sed1]|nr:serine protease [Dolichospermum sp. ST_sed1]MDD1426163.1 serine protease [Dolichospermum sp. ST_sed9]MDD1433578.1 serine protease [Dolichospermum sp. ST_sed6]MDD1436556.1 serine protease [Dolichospermum sp. ST_sed10]MDD1441929.1 serine protease [Dolichospermum sp. ST_sed3]MDD1447854.1 serine protease [Dolichospermum sp. ST_sed8]MDD1457646.1 serine protease [Dolichospermum sp. ST_sed7]MDD1461480.1 serine protease [Dolichospermum sp. ST_sed2]MDD1473802.1 serine protease [Dolichospermum sp.